MSAVLGRLGVVAVSLIIGCNQRGPAIDSSHERVVELFGGQDGLKPLTEATKVEAFRVAALSVTHLNSPPELFADYPISGHAVPIDKATAAALVSVLSDPKTYAWGTLKECTFEPGAAVRFTAKSSTTEVVFCFWCDELKIYRDGQRVGGEYFDNAHGRIVRIFKGLFPEDAEFQKMK